MANKHDFKITLIAQRAFSLVIYGINQISSWIENISINFIISASMFLNIVLSNNLLLVSSIVSTIKAMIKPSSNVSQQFSIIINKLSSLISVSTSTLEKLYLNINISYFKALYRVSSGLSETLNIYGSIIIAFLVKLGVYDPQTLGDMDGSTLGELDSVVYLGEFTVTIASPALVTLFAHNLTTGAKIYITTTGSLPTGLSQNVYYYVIYQSNNSFNLALTYSDAIGNIPINTSGSQSGIHTMYYIPS